MNDFSKMYYENIGYCPTTEEEEKTDNFFSYLVDAGVNSNNIIKYIENKEYKEFLDNSDIVDDFYIDSLLKKGVTYYHNLLNTISPAPIYDIEHKSFITTKYYREPKIVFTYNDVLNHFYKNHDKTLIYDTKRDMGSINYLITRYQSLEGIEAIDFILYLIDYSSSLMHYVGNILDITKIETEVYEEVRKKISIMKDKKKDRIVWR